MSKASQGKSAASGSKRSSKRATSKKKTSAARGSANGESPPLSERRRAQRIYRKLEATYPDARCALDHRNAYELLVATILSAQCTDARVNMVTPELFRQYPDPGALARSKPDKLESLIRSTGFYRNKAKALRGMAKAVHEQYGDRVPDTMEQLLELPGVARKTANVLLGNAYGVNVGVVVDTHIARLSQRMGFTTHKDPGRIERDLMGLFKRQQWTMLAHLLIFHGRAICKARKPMCDACPVAKDCPKVGVG